MRVKYSNKQDDGNTKSTHKSHTATQAGNSSSSKYNADLSGFLPSIALSKTQKKKMNRALKKKKNQQTVAAALKAFKGLSNNQVNKMKRSIKKLRKERPANTVPYKVHTIKVDDYKPQSINTLACDETRNQVAMARQDGSIEIWSFCSGQWFQLTEVHSEPCASVEALVWRAGILYSAGLNGFLNQHHPDTFEFEMTIPSHTSAIWCLALSPSQRYLAAGSEDNCIVMFEWNDLTSFTYQGTFQKQSERLLCIDWHASGEKLVTGGINVIHLWDRRSKSAILSMNIHNSIVWTVKILEDLTIVSGDSTGTIAFWNGKNGTQKQAFKCHSADVFSLHITRDELSVFAAGVDPQLFQFFRSQIESNTPYWREWMAKEEKVRSRHFLDSYDVRTLDRLGCFLISGGLAGVLRATHLSDLTDSNDKVSRSIKSCPIHLPLISPIRIAKQASMVLMQYPSRLQLWRLVSFEEEDSGDKDMPSAAVPLHNLLEITSHHNEHIQTSAISPSAKWIAYANRHDVRIFRIDQETVGFTSSARRLSGIQNKLSESPVKCMEFISENELILGCLDGTVRYVRLADKRRPSVQSVIEPSPSSHPFPVKTGMVCRLAVCPVTRRIAVSDSNKNIIIYKLTETDSTPNTEIVVQHVFPKSKQNLDDQRQRVTAIAFSPNQEKIALAYAQCTNEYLILELKLPVDSKSDPLPLPSGDYFEDFKMTCETPVVNLKYSLVDRSLIIVQHETHVTFFNTKTRLLSEKRNLCNPGQFILHFEELDAHSALAVQVNESAIEEMLPERLMKPKFGVQ